MAERVCANCEGPLESEYATKYCSPECFHEGHSFAGEKNPNYKGAKKSTTCEICGTRFDFYPSDKPGLFCADCVKNEQWQTSPRISGSDHPRWGGGKITKICDVCGEKVTRHPSGFADNVTLCSPDCQGVWLSDSFTGQGHPNWKGGGNEAYGKGWRRAKLTTLERDDYTCLVCGKTKDDIGRNPDVHHIVPVRAFVEADGADKEDAHASRNLVTLCVTCHRRADFGRPSKAELKEFINPTQ